MVAFRPTMTSVPTTMITIATPTPLAPMPRRGVTPVLVNRVIQVMALAVRM
jgi:hypothetical protein